jgi:hypothetical protein
MTQQIVDYAITALVPILGSLLTLGAYYLNGWLKQRIQHEKVRALIDRATETTGIAVAATEQTFVRELKKAREDGKLTSEEATEAAGVALHENKALLGPVFLAELESQLGEVDRWLLSLQEAKLATMKYRSLRPVSH